MQLARILGDTTPDGIRPGDAEWKVLRFEVLKRDKFRCTYCGAVGSSIWDDMSEGAVLHVDHIWPLALGGENHMGNLTTACEPCNIGKGATPLEAAPIVTATWLDNQLEYGPGQMCGELVIHRVEYEEWKGKVLHFLYFEDCHRRLILNKTNLKWLRRHCGRKKTTSILPGWGYHKRVAVTLYTRVTEWGMGIGLRVFKPEFGDEGY